MPYYRIYRTTPDGHIVGPPVIVDCADDQEAIGKASQVADGRTVELWQGARLILRLPMDRSE